MRTDDDGNGKPGVAGGPDDLAHDALPGEAAGLPSVEDEDLFAATEDPAWSLRETHSD